MRFSPERVAAVARKELLHLRRDRLTGAMIAGIPVMMTLLFGYAINQDIRHLRAGVADLAGTQRARWLAADAQATQVIDLAEVFPLTHFLRIIRGIVLRGAELRDVGGELWPLALFFMATLALALLRFRKRLD